MAEDFEIVGKIVVDQSGAMSIQGLNNDLNGLSSITSGLGQTWNYVWGNLITGAIYGVGRAIGEVKDAVIGFGKDSIASAMESQDALANLDATIQSTSVAMGTFSTTTTALSEEGLTKLQDKLETATNRLEIMQAKYDALKNPTEAQTIALRQQKEKVAELNAELDAGSKTMTTVTEKTQLSRDALIGLADAFQKTTNFSDETIINGEAMLLTFTSIGKDIFPMATEAMLNLAEKFGSIDSASIQLGKALNDPISGVTALRRVGVMLTDDMEAQIKKFMELGDIESAQKIILGELETEFGGLAVAMGTTASGQAEILKNRFDEIKEGIGGALLPLIGQFKIGLNEMMPSFEQWGIALSTWLKSDEVAAFATNIEGFLQKVVGVIDSIAEAGVGSSEMWESISAIFGGNMLTDLIRTGDWTPVYDAIDTWFANIIQNLTNTVNTWIDSGGPDELTAKILGWIEDIGTNPEIQSKTLLAMQSLLLALVEAVGAIDWQAIIDAIDNKLAESIAGHDWAASGRQFRESIIGMFTGGADGIKLPDNWLLLIISPSIYYVVNFFKNSDTGQAIKDAVKSWFTGFIDLSDFKKLLMFGFDDIIKAVLGFFGIKSPSSIFAGIAEALVDGLTMGWSTRFPAFLDFIRTGIGQLLNLFAPVADILGLDKAGVQGSWNTTTGSVGGRSTGAGGATGAGGGQVVNNYYYGPVYFGAAGEPGAYYDCPSPNPLMTSTATGGVVGGTIKAR